MNYCKRLDPVFTIYIQVFMCLDGRVLLQLCLFLSHDTITTQPLFC